MPLSPELDQKIRKRFDELIAESRQLGPHDRAYAEHEAFIVKARTLVTLVVGGTRKAQELEEHINHLRKGWHVADHVKLVAGVLAGLKDDYENDLLDSLEKRIVAEVSADYMTLVEALLDEDQSGPSGYIPAAMLCGAILEGALRRLCERQSPSVPTEKENGKNKLLNALIQDIQKADAFNKLKANQLRTWASVRNSADHGNFCEFDRKQVEEMVRGVTDFLADYL